MCEQWTAGPKSVFQFDVQGQVATSTHAGLPWLLWLREMFGAKPRPHFWPFDGFEVPEGKSVVAEDSILKNFIASHIDFDRCLAL